MWAPDSQLRPQPDRCSHYLEFMCQDHAAHTVRMQPECLLPLLHFGFKLQQQLLEQGGFGVNGAGPCRDPALVSWWH